MHIGHVMQAATGPGQVKRCIHIRQLVSGTHAAAAFGSKTNQASPIHKQIDLSMRDVSQVIAMAQFDKACPMLICLSLHLMVT